LKQRFNPSDAPSPEDVQSIADSFQQQWGSCYYTSAVERRNAIRSESPQVSWQWFVTLTFPWNVRSETADTKLKQWLNLIERTIQTQVCFVDGKERKPRSRGMEVPWHFHLLVTSLVDIPKWLVEDTWRYLLSRRSVKYCDPGSAQSPARIVEALTLAQIWSAGDL
jgi:hypothetical protein